ncbi:MULTISPECIES: hypothetical protein [Paraburkholderia]|uniref:hypothetical protein n=1 Tax=Paraburkholderia TaxID=1822464 RepID=UPI001CC71A59|nr:MULTISPECIES: hypothetical protein [Paraburkholderia]
MHLSFHPLLHAIAGYSMLHWRAIHPPLTRYWLTIGAVFARHCPPLSQTTYVIHRPLTRIDTGFTRIDFYPHGMAP